MAVTTSAAGPPRKEKACPACGSEETKPTASNESIYECCNWSCRVLYFSTRADGTAQGRPTGTTLSAVGGH